MLKTVSILGVSSSGGSGNLTIADGSNTVNSVTLVTLTGGIANISGAGANAVLNVQGVNATDNTTTINNITNITFNGAKISGNSVQVIVTSGTSLLNEVVTSNSQATVTFSNIANNYRDLIIIARGRSNANASSAQVNINMNGDNGNNYDMEKENRFSNVSGNATNFGILGDLTALTTPANYPGGIYARIFDYRGTTFYKQVQSQCEILVDLNTKANEVMGIWWRNTQAITSITITIPGAGFVNNSVVSLYGSL